MAQETRKDPRAKVLTVTVRYKSATLDEFIEQHSHDVSRGGMFIKTVSPFPAGTLLKIEVRIAGDQRVMQGVGRVVWKRESTEAHDGVPAGMGVKFIKIDDASRGVIDQLVAKSGGAVSAFERGGGEAAAPVAAAASATPPPVPAETAKAAARKQTMIGLGGLAADSAKVEDEEKTKEGFFPTSDEPAPQPAPEDRTVMKQAAELLQDALREAGGSLDEVGTPAANTLPRPAAKRPPRPRAPRRSRSRTRRPSRSPRPRATRSRRARKLRAARTPRAARRRARRRRPSLPPRRPLPPNRRARRVRASVPRPRRASAVPRFPRPKRPLRSPVAVG
jgi:uncharacterized protein (TIGR02266 family)